MTNSSLRIAGVVVLYHPPPEVLENIRSWAGQVDSIYAVDNSEGDSSAVVSAIADLENVTLIRNRDNEGIARALNAGAALAGEAGFDFLLTMDQDSCSNGDLVPRMLEFCVEECDRIGMISPFHRTGAERVPPAERFQQVMTPMTSGCLLKLSAYREVGPFRDDFFIDFVDNEYCLRLRRAGFSVVRANRALLEHRVGDTKRYGPFVATHHSPLRRYYKTRNRMWVFREYAGDFPGHCLFDLVRLTKEIVSIILFEGAKREKLRMMWRGWCDYRRGRFGKYAGRN